MNNMKFIHYQALPGEVLPEGSFRCGPHCDLSTLTFLFQKPGEGTAMQQG